MNIAKNMEALFLAAIAVVSLSTAATAATPTKLINPPATRIVVDASSNPNMIVITHTAKRMTAAEKAASI